MRLQIDEGFTIVIGTMFVYNYNYLYLIWFNSGYGMILIREIMYWLEQHINSDRNRSNNTNKDHY